MVGGQIAKGSFQYFDEIEQNLAYANNDKDTVYFNDTVTIWNQ